MRSHILALATRGMPRGGRLVVRQTGVPLSGGGKARSVSGAGPTARQSFATYPVVGAHGKQQRAVVLLQHLRKVRRARFDAAGKRN